MKLDIKKTLPLKKKIKPDAKGIALADEEMKPDIKKTLSLNKENEARHKGIVSDNKKISKLTEEGMYTDWTYLK